MNRSENEIDSDRLNAICYARCLPHEFVKKFLFRKLSDDGADVMTEYIDTPTMTSMEVWNLLSLDDREVLKDFLKAFGRYKWKWIMVQDGERKDD
jgi:hypothetical protein